MSKKRILVTGGAGFIGSHLVDALAKRGHFVCAVDDESGGTFKNIESLHGTSDCCHMWMDCADYVAMRTLVQRSGFDTLVHCAANAREGASQFQPYSVTRRNLLAYQATLSACLAGGVKEVVLMSSMSVYGASMPPFYEDMPRRPVDVYAVNKAAMEHVTEILADVHDFKYAIIRPHNVFGERQCLTDIHRNVVAIFMNRIMRGEPLFIYGDGTQKRALSYIIDSLPAFVRAVENVPDIDREIVNVGGIAESTINFVADCVVSSMGVDEAWPREYLEDRPCEVKNAYASYQKSQTLLGYKESVGFVHGIELMAAWARKQGPQGWRTTDALELVNEKTPKPWIQVRG